MCFIAAQKTMAPHETQVQSSKEMSHCSLAHMLTLQHRFLYNCRPNRATRRVCMSCNSGRCESLTN